MPHRTGPGTYKGFESPQSSGWPQPIRDEIRTVYGAWRSKHPNENRATKARGARIAWYQAKRKYPVLYRQHVKDSRRLTIGTRQEMKEHPWAGPKIAARIARDHERTVRSSIKGRRHRIADLHATAREERRWSRTAHNEAVSEGKRSTVMKKAGRPVQAKDLKRDSEIAKDFAKFRKKEADKYDMEADRISTVTGG